MKLTLDTSQLDFCDRDQMARFELQCEILVSEVLRRGMTIYQLATLDPTVLVFRIVGPDAKTEELIKAFTEAKMLPAPRKGEVTDDRREATG